MGIRCNSFFIAMDRLSLAGMALGVALILQPWWAGGLKVGFVVTIFSTLCQVVFSHLVPREEP